MTIKKNILLFIISMFVFASIPFYVLRDSDRSQTDIDLVEVNDIAKTLSKQWSTLEQDELPRLYYDLDYVVLDDQNDFIASTRSGLNNTINSAISNRDTIVDIKSDQEVVGKLIIYNNTNNILQQNRQLLLTFSMLMILFNASIYFIYTMYVNKSIIKPFRKLQVFAKHVAEGNLDIPLEMDRGNMFGAFTESFDLMRNELDRARENEKLADQSKKEIVASLSHDIKTPVASIKAVSELMYFKSQNENEKDKLAIINSKADQINALITNIFIATLEDLQELKVSVSEQSSNLLYDLIINSDYYNQVTLTTTHECIVLMDVLRLSQVIDNVISNSYKYADTSINVSIYIKDKYLEIAFKDYGLGVPEDEIPLIFNKFYRAINSEGKSGSGLGLYISKYLMNKMSGDIDCENTHEGFVIRLKLLIV